MNTTTDKFTFIPASMESVLEQATTKLRWRNGVLQQVVICSYMRGDCVVRVTNEWRDVPTDNESLK